MEGASGSRTYNQIGNKKPKPISEDATKKKEPNSEKKAYCLADFEIQRLLGQGAFGLVYLAKHIASSKVCALKQIDKTVVRKMGKSEHAKTEKTILTTSKSPYLLKAKVCFQDKHLAWLGLEYCPGGDLQDFLSVINCFDEHEAVLYFAEMIMGVHDLHAMGYLHRDLKPANFLIDKSGHIKLADFGLSKHVYAVGKIRASERDSEDSGEEKGDSSRRPGVERRGTSGDAITPAELAKREREIWRLKTKYDRATLLPSNFKDNFQCQYPLKRTDQRLSAKIQKLVVPIKVVIEKKELRRELGHSIVGSPEYMSPEITIGRHQGGSYYGEEVDWWSLGCVFFEMIFGCPPFQADSVDELFAEIDLWREKLPKIFEQNKDNLSDACYSLLTGFLCDPKNRLGRDLNQMKAHPFFKEVDWNNLMAMNPPFVPTAAKEMAFF